MGFSLPLIGTLNLISVIARIVFNMKYLKIDIKEIKFLVNSYENWYNTFDKDGYKYVIEQLNFDQKYYNQLLSSLHNFVKGGEFYPIKIK